MLRFVCDGDTLAAQLHTHFEAFKDDPDSVLDPVRNGLEEYTSIQTVKIMKS